jgi:hypothetical protein
MSEGINSHSKDNKHPIQNTLADRLKESLDLVDLCQYKVKTDLLDGPQDKRIILDSRKYYNQAHNYFVIPFKNPVPDFLVSLTALPPKLIKELANLINSERQTSCLKAGCQN